MAIKLKRAYEKPAKSDGCRILVERLWPRGVSKEAAKIDHWARDLAPSTELRKWFDHDPDKWPEFQRRYLRELKGNAAALDELREMIRTGPATFVFASRETRLSCAVVLKEHLEDNP